MNTSDTTTPTLITIIDWLSAYAHLLGGEAMRAELARHREALTRPPVAPLASTPTCWAAFTEFFAAADRSMTPPEWGVLQRRVGLLEARRAMVPHVSEIVPVWRALGRVAEADVLAAYEGVVGGRQ